MQSAPIRAVLAALLLFLVSATAAPQVVPIAPKDYAKWESLGPGVLSPDGKWLAYEIGRVSRDDELRLRRLDGEAKHDLDKKVVAFGSGAAFSDDSRWLAYSIGYSETEREKREKAKQPIQNKMGLVDLTTGKAVVVEDVASFDFSDDGACLAMRGYPLPGKKSKGVDLVVRDLAAGRDTNFGNVSRFAWQKKGALLAMIVDAEGKKGNGVLLFDPKRGVLRTLDSADATYTGLSWREDEDDLAVLRSHKDEAYEDETHVVLAWKDLAGAPPARKVYDPKADRSFPADTRIVDYRPLTWSDDGSVLVLGIREWDKKPGKSKAAEKSAAGETPKTEEKGGTGTSVALDAKKDAPKDSAAPADSKGGEEPALVEVWHARDVDVLTEQKIQAEQNRRRSYPAAWHLEAGRFVRLGTDLNEQVSLVKGWNLAISQDRTPYDTDRRFGPVLRDVYLIDLATGKRTLVRKRVEYLSGTSPAGRYLLYFDENHYWCYDLKSGTHTNLTKNVPTSFADLEDDRTVKQKRSFGHAGWTKDDRAVLLYDKYDLWEVRPDGSAATRRTNGGSEAIRHRYVRLDPEEEFIDPDKPLYLSLYGEWTKRSGYARMSPGKTPERLLWQDKNVARLAKAEKADVFAFVAQDFNDSPDYFVGGPALADARQVTETNPFQKDYAWGRSQLVDYKSTRGQRLQGALFYPAGYEAGKPCPMIVLIYEKLSQTVHSYSVPSERSPYNPAVFTSRGYFVLQPDIVYRDRNPGLSAAECVLPAVKKVLETGMVDRRRVGLVGHSWGAYQTAFLVTQTDLFSAAVAGAPLTDLVSMYLSIYGNSGGTNARIFEISQGRMGVPPWEDLKAYLANSPLFNIQTLNTPLLVAFGDKDGAVNWNQGVELYNAARRADKPLVMLVYEGENHGLAKKPNQLDYHRRILAWFDHYLKGGTAPKWITEGTTFLDREKELKRSQIGGGTEKTGPQ